MNRAVTAVIVVNFGSSALLSRNLVALGRAGEGLQIIVVDNFSSEMERRRVADLAARQGWLLVALDENRGFAAGANAGIDAAMVGGVKSYLLLNPDVRITGADVRVIVDQLSEDRCSIISPTLRAPDGSVSFRGEVVDLASGQMRRRRPTDHLVGELPWLTGACMLLSREVWEVVGRFDEDYFMYWEDVDYCVRATRAGVRLRLSEQVTATHDGGGTQPRTAGGGKSSLYYYLNVKNRMLFAKKNLPPALVRLWLRKSAQAAYQVALQQGGRRKFLRTIVPPLQCLRGAAHGALLVHPLPSLTRRRRQ